MTQENISYIKVAAATLFALGIYNGILTIFPHGNIKAVERKINVLERKLDSLESKIPPIQIYEGNIIGNTNSERFVQINGIRFYNQVEGKSVENYVSEVNTLKSKLEELK